MTVERTPARESVVSQVRRAVVVGDLLPGEKLREVRLAATLDVSRSTLREALNLLVQDGLLVQEPYRGFSVARLDADALRDVAQVRVLLDLSAVRAILADGTGRRRAMVLDAWEAFSRSASDPDPLAQHEAHLAFHHGIWSASENTMLLRLWPVTEAMSTLMLAQDQALHPDPERSHRAHRLLVDAIVAGDIVETERLLHEHIVDSAEELASLQEPAATAVEEVGA